MSESALHVEDRRPASNINDAAVWRKDSHVMCRSPSPACSRAGLRTLREKRLRFGFVPSLVRHRKAYRSPAGKIGVDVRDERVYHRRRHGDGSVVLGLDSLLDDRRGVLVHHDPTKHNFLSQRVHVTDPDPERIVPSGPEPATPTVPSALRSDGSGLGTFFPTRPRRYRAESSSQPGSAG